MSDASITRVEGIGMDIGCVLFLRRRFVWHGMALAYTPSLHFHKRNNRLTELLHQCIFFRSASYAPSLCLRPLPDLPWEVRERFISPTIEIM